MLETASQGAKRLLTLRLPGWLLFVLWLYVGIKALFFTDWIFEAARAALGYVRAVEFGDGG